MFPDLRINEITFIQNDRPAVGVFPGFAIWKSTAAEYFNYPAEIIFTLKNDGKIGLEGIKEVCLSPLHWQKNDLFTAGSAALGTGLLYPGTSN